MEASDIDGLRIEYLDKIRRLKFIVDNSNGMGPKAEVEELISLFIGKVVSQEHVK
tara:strand:+ start:651 stop:815 length:165 start_codon:yes stop_codon:yes gene_type:complete